MRQIGRYGTLVLAGGVILSSSGALGGSFEELSPRRRAHYTAGAVAANVVPGVSATVEPKCIQGYILCKASFAIFSVAAAIESVVLSGGSDMEQPRGILSKGFTGDWVVTPRDVAGETKPELLPEVAAPSGGSKDEGSGFVPPPL
jgi:hypothetical protein